ncbi:MAG: prefoldin subunit beta [Candidatus Nezhaarchaeales archaeon]
MQPQIPQEVQYKIMQFQELQERIRALIVRRQQLEVELREVESALDELKTLSGETPIFKFAGRILMRVNKDSMIKELSEKKETLELHIRTLERQEVHARKRLEELRQDLNQALSGISGT